MPRLLASLATCFRMATGTLAQTTCRQSAFFFGVRFFNITGIYHQRYTLSSALFGYAYLRFLVE